MAFGDLTRELFGEMGLRGIDEAPTVRQVGFAHDLSVCREPAGRKLGRVDDGRRGTKMGLKRAGERPALFVERGRLQLAFAGRSAGASLFAVRPVIRARIASIQDVGIHEKRARSA